MNCEIGIFIHSFVSRANGNGKWKWHVLSDEGKAFVFQQIAKNLNRQFLVWKMNKKKKKWETVADKMNKVCMKRFCFKYVASGCDLFVLWNMPFENDIVFCATSNWLQLFLWCMNVDWLGWNCDWCLRKCIYSRLKWLCNFDSIDWCILKHLYRISSGARQCF